MRLRRALEYRTKYFTIAAAIVLPLALVAPLTSGIFQRDVSLDGLTYGVLAFEIITTLLFGFRYFNAGRIERSVRLTPREVEPGPTTMSRYTPSMLRAGNLIGAAGPPRSLEELGRTLSAVGAAMLARPILLGLVLFTISGDAWRELIFVPVSLAAAAIYWVRIGSALTELDAAEPFAP